MVFEHGGYLFQNRYKSIVCDEDAYFTELVRYIHLNPLRAKLVKSLAQLDRYRWSGHGVLMGIIKNDWQDCDYVLKYFGKKEGAAKKAYRNYVKKAIDEGRRPELVGGGLIRSLGGWSAVKAMRRSGDRELSDDRILGSGDFVERIIKEAEARIKYQLPVPYFYNVVSYERRRWPRASSLIEKETLWFCIGCYWIVGAVLLG